MIAVLVASIEIPTICDAYFATTNARQDSDITQFREGVSTIAAPGIPGNLAVIADKAFVVATGGMDGGTQAPVVVAAEWGRGRVVVFGHGGYLSKAALQTADTGQLMLNALEWSHGRQANRRQIDVSVGHVCAGGIGDALNTLDPSSQNINFTFAQLDSNNWHTQLDNLDILIVDTHQLQSAEQRDAVAAFVKRGGGLITSGLGWGWQQLNSNKDLATQHPGNQLLAEAGILFLDGYLKETHADGYDVSQLPNENTHALTALETLTRKHETGEGDNKTVQQAATTLVGVVRTLPPRDRLLRPRLRKVERSLQGRIVPKQHEPLGPNQSLERVLLTLQIAELENTPANRIKAHPAAAEFPGVPEKTARKVARTINIDPTIAGWHSTGLYALPGEVVRVELPESALQYSPRIRIGAHKDKLWHKANWQRVPDITKSEPIAETRHIIASAFGGLVYIEIPKAANDERSQFEIQITNVIEAPYFKLNETSLEDWQQTIRNHPATWAEVASDKVVITVPSKVVRNLDRPDELMQFWDQVMDACADLAAIPHERTRPERYVTDMQISAGYMHAGYPIMTGLDVIETIVDREKLASGNGVWGFYHEMGHNHQHPDWTFSGTGEVTCNLFSLYVIETVCGKPRDEGHDSLSAESRGRAMAKYFAEGTKFDDWKRQPFLALIMYAQLRDAFGWDAYKNVFAEYQALDRSQRPKNDLEKRDQWMVRFSREVGRNLGPFFEKWGVPTSVEARESIADLPVWMPEDFESQE